MSSTALRRNAQLGRKLCTKCGSNLPKRSEAPGEYHKPYPFKTCPLCREGSKIDRAFDLAVMEKSVREYDAAHTQPAARAIRSVVIDGRHFDVIFDGT